MDTDEDGDTLMVDAPPISSSPPYSPFTIYSSPASLEQHNSFHPSNPSSSPPTLTQTEDPNQRQSMGIVQVPVRQDQLVPGNSALQFVPYDNPAVWSVQPLRWHRRHAGLFMFRYTDFRGWPAVMPAADEARIREYFAPLDREISMGDGKMDTDGAMHGNGLLVQARLWACWAQGFTVLEPELRWALTLVFDLACVLIEKQRAAALLPLGMTGGSGGDPARLFWEGRYYLHDLMVVVRRLSDAFHVEGLSVPRFDWFEEC
ncbi:hypothetical protein GGR54DRAFT_641279 [Hypoxylon sp. NC1633]|nr:hypothetical protein GGR54DRAFT_641279 [Hypoxylon sp. NC1633]